MCTNLGKDVDFIHPKILEIFEEIKNKKGFGWMKELDSIPESLLKIYSKLYLEYEENKIENNSFLLLTLVSPRCKAVITKGEFKIQTFSPDSFNVINVDPSGTTYYDINHPCQQDLVRTMIYYRTNKNDEWTYLLHETLKVCNINLLALKN